MLKSEFLKEVKVEGKKGLVMAEMEMLFRKCLDKKVLTKEDILVVAENSTKPQIERMLECFSVISKA